MNLKWSLVPSFAEHPRIGYKLDRARRETVTEKPSFRNASKRQRCLMLADGFNEWRREGMTKQPFHIRMNYQHPFAFAGLWER
ncbi:MAG: hypothetical protein E4H32_02595 [Nitrospirales bacterium]|nr:MAG: hypothetical protein E4H32_02595 [Nitrospirales bacterium]